MKQCCRTAMILLMAFVLTLPLAFAAAEAGAGAETAVTAAPAGSSQTVLKSGSSGSEVTRLQQRLKDLGYLSGEADGKYGRETRLAVISFQRRNGLETDGTAGPATLAKLYSADAVAAPENTGPTDVLAGSLPMLINKDHTVDEYFEPADLVTLADVIDSSLAKIKYPKTRGVRKAAEALKALLEAAQEDGVTKWQVSAGYRTWSDQVGMLNAKISSYLARNKNWGRGKARRAALRTVAEPGASEHHLGLAFDVNVPGASTFSGTKQCEWLHEHCWDYGFIIRYPEGKEKVTGFEAEAWHIRYVGLNHAQYMQENSLCLEEYLAGIEAGEIEVPQEIVSEEIILD